MKNQLHFLTDLAAGLLLFGGSLILAQTTTAAKKTPATATASANKQAVETAPATSTGGAGSADGTTLDSAHATDAAEKKHIAGVKYQDNVVTTGTASDERASGVASNPTAAPNAMAIKENGISSKPAVKPHQ
jgi:hypothetical protein